MSPTIPRVHEFPFKIRENTFGFGVVYDDYDILLHDHESHADGLGIILEWHHFHELNDLDIDDQPTAPTLLGRDRLGDPITISATRCEHNLTRRDIHLRNDATDAEITLSPPALETITATLETLDYPQLTKETVTKTPASEFCGAIADTPLSPRK